MSDLLTRLAERALGVAAPALEPRLPSRYAGASSDDESGFVEESVEMESAPSSLPRRSASPNRIAEPPVAHPPAPFEAVEEGRAADEPRRIHPPAVPAAVPPRAEAESVDAHPPIDPPRRAAHPVGPAPARPAPAEDGLREVDAFVEAEDDFAPLFPPSRARMTDARRVDAGADDPHLPRAVEPAGDEGGIGQVVKVVEGEPEERARTHGVDSAADEVDLREVVKVVEREADGSSRPRADLRVAEADAPRRADVVPARAAERGPMAESAEGREDGEPARPVVRVSIGRIEVRAAPAAPAPQPAARPGWSPPVMPLADYLKREAGR